MIVASQPLRSWAGVALIAAALIAACADDAGADELGAGSEAETLGDCGTPSGAGVAHRVVLSGRYVCAPPAAPTAEVVTDAAAWGTRAGEIAACTSLVATPAAVDFDTEYVVVLGAAAFMTCGFELDGVSAVAQAGGPYVELEVTDRSAGCEVACASGGAYVVAVAVPRSAGEAPTLCRRVNPGCL